MEKQGRSAKIVIAGDPAVGKTSLRARYLGQGFRTEYMETLGADFAVYDSKIDDIQIGWQIWDLSGETKYHDVLKRFYYGSFGGVVVYDVTRGETQANVLNWVRDIWEHSTYSEKIPIVLLSNKIDLSNPAHRSLARDMGEKLANDLAAERGGHVPFLETSAKTGDMVIEAFEELGRLVIEFADNLRLDQD